MCRHGDQHKPYARGRGLLAAEGRQHSFPGHPIADIQQVSAALPGISSAVLRISHERSGVTLEPSCLYWRMC